MNAHALSLFDQPRSRATDPNTSHLAAVSVTPANDDLKQYIHRALWRCGPLTQEQIATEVERARPNRWTRGTVVSACSRAGLYEWDRDVNARGRQVIVWSLTAPPIQDVELKTDVL